MANYLKHYFKNDKKIDRLELHEIMRDCNTLNEIFDEVDKYYDLDQKLGVVSLAVVKGAVKQVLETCQIKERD